jgi:hypothetical protein
MFELFRKYGADVARLAHRIADVIEADGPALVEGLRLLGHAIPSAGGVASALVAAVEGVEALAAPLASKPAALDPAIAAAVQDADRAIEEGAFIMPTQQPAVPSASRGWVNPQREQAARIAAGLPE